MLAKIKEIIMKIGPKKTILGVMAILPIIGIAVSPDFADNFATHLAGLLQLMLDALPEGAAEATAEAASAVPAE